MNQFPLKADEVPRVTAAGVSIEHGGEMKEDDRLPGGGGRDISTQRRCSTSVPGSGMAPDLDLGTANSPEPNLDVLIGSQILYEAPFLFKNVHALMSNGSPYRGPNGVTVHTFQVMWNTQCDRPCHESFWDLMAPHTNRPSFLQHRCGNILRTKLSNDATDLPPSTVNNPRLSTHPPLQVSSL
jgi:hypothetical protein